MRRFTDHFICRPVLAMVVSLFLLVMGARAYMSLEVRQYPQMNNTLIKVVTAYPGASSSLVEGFITTVLEQSIAGAEGIDYMTSTSYMGQSTISVYIRSGFDPSVAFTDVNALVQSQVALLPKEALLPAVSKQTGSDTAAMYIGFQSESMSAAQMGDYLMRAVKPKLFTVPGISQLTVLGSGGMAMRIWVNTQKMASLGISFSQLNEALSKNDLQSAAGVLKGQFVQMDVLAKTGISSVKAFKNLVVSQKNNTIIRVKDFAKVKFGQQSYDTVVSSSGKPIVAIAVYPDPSANALTVAAGIKQLFPEIKSSMPSSMTLKMLYDSSNYVKSAISDVLKALWEAVAIVVLVILLFLGSFRAVLIPVITIPLSLLGTLMIMAGLGYTINLMTLLAFVIAVSLVVDDAIVVMENIYRHLEEGLSPFQAAIRGAREIAFPVIVMTLTLIIVYIPIGFMTGITGTLFKEFAFTLAATVLVSGVLALTLSPLMSSRFLTKEAMQTKTVKIVDHFFDRFRRGYEKLLAYMLNFRILLVCFAIFVIGNCFYLFMGSHSELAPQEDSGVVFAFGFAPQYASLNYDLAYMPAMRKVMNANPKVDISMQAAGIGQVSNVLGLSLMKPWDQRPNVSTTDVQYQIMGGFQSIPGLLLIAVQPPPLPSAGKGMPIAFQVVGLDPIEKVYGSAMQLLVSAMKSKLFASIQPGVFMSRPELVVHIDRNKAGMLGLSMQSIATALASAMGGNYINYFGLENRSYQVIPEAQRRFRLNPDNIGQIHVKNSVGLLIPLSTVVSFSTQVIPNQLSRFQQQNAVQLSGVMAPGHTIGDGLEFLIAESKKIFPKGITYDTSGQSRQYMQEGNALVIAFGLGIIIIYLVLSAQFESFRDPLIILISVPMSVFGALLPVYFGFATLNIYTEVGLLTLIGLISKHGILLVQFANDLRKFEGYEKMPAIIHACGTRLRPILMTTAAMVFGMLPLIFSSGAGAASNQAIGLVIAFGMLIGTCFTLFVVPAFYSYIAGPCNPIPDPDEDLPLLKKPAESE